MCREEIEVFLAKLDEIQSEFETIQQQIFALNDEITIGFIGGCRFRRKISKHKNIFKTMVK